jgi:hypothetical protein
MVQHHRLAVPRIPDGVQGLANQLRRERRLLPRDGVFFRIWPVVRQRLQRIRVAVRRNKVVLAWVLLSLLDLIDGPTLHDHPEGDFEEFALSGRAFGEDQSDDVLTYLDDDLVGGRRVEPFRHVLRDLGDVPSELIDEAAEQTFFPASIAEYPNEVNKRLAANAVGCPR